MSQPQTWDKLLEHRKRHLFIGREQERAVFRRNFAYTMPEYLLFVIYGPAGIGKSTLLTQYREIAEEYKALTVVVDANQATAIQEQTILKAMVYIARQCARAQLPLIDFEERYAQYVTCMQAIADDAETPAGVFDLLAGNMEASETQNRLWTTYLVKKFEDPDKVTLVKRPMQTLTYFLLKALNTLAVERRLLLCFDDWERLSPHLAPWLHDSLLEGHLSTNLWVAIASQDSPSNLANWETFRPVMINLKLQPFTDKETLAYLKTQNITATDRQKDILTFSKGLPILINLLASTTSGQAGDLALNAVDRYLKWLDTPAQRNAVLKGALARRLTEDVLATIMEDAPEPHRSTFSNSGPFKNAPPLSPHDLFEWMTGTPLLIQRTDDWGYHPALRPRVLEFAQGHYPRESRLTHEKLYDYYHNLCVPQTEHPLLYRDPGWRKNKLEALYHGLMLENTDVIREGLETFLIALRTYYALAGDVLLTWQQAAREQPRENQVTEWATVLNEGWIALENEDWPQVLEFCDLVYQREEHLNTEAREALETIRDKAGAATSEDADVTPPEAAPVPEAQAETESQEESEAAPTPPETPPSEPEAAPSVTAPSQEPSAVQDTPQPVAALQNVGEEPREATTPPSVETPIDMEEEQPEAAPPSVETPMDAEADHPEAPPPPVVAEADTDEEQLDATEEDSVIIMESPSTEPSEPSEAVETAPTPDEMTTETREEAQDEPAADVTEEETAEDNSTSSTTYTSWDEVEQAIDEYTRTVDPNPAYAVAYNNRANAYFDLGEYAKAIQEYSKAIEINPQYAVAYNNRGLAHMQLKQYERAVQDYTRAFTLNPQYATAYNNRGLAHARMGEYQQAIEDYTQALTLTPDNPTVYNNRANAHYNLRDYTQAIADYNQAIALDEAYTDAYLNRGLAHSRLKDYNQALADYSQVLQLNPRNDLAHIYRGTAYTSLKDYKSALEEYAQALNINPKNASAYNQRGLLHVKLEDYAQAIQEYRQAVTLNPSYATPHYNAACAAALMGDADIACDWLKKAIALDGKYQAMAQRDSDFDLIRDDPKFQDLIAPEAQG